MALCSLYARKLHQQTLKHFLVWLAKRTSLILNDTQMNTSRALHCNAQDMCGMQCYRGSTLMVAFIHECPQYSLHGRSILPRCHRRLRSWRVLTPGHTRQLVPPTSSVIRSSSLLIAHQEDGQRTKPSLQISPSTWIGNGP